MKSNPSHPDGINQETKWENNKEIVLIADVCRGKEGTC